MARKSTAKKTIEDNNPVVDEARQAVLDKALGEIIKRYGEGAIMRM
jgi:recombination protein RecA